MPTTVQSSAARLAAVSAALKSLLEGHLEPQEFYAGWLSRVIAACGATGGRLRRPAADGTLAIAASQSFQREVSSAETFAGTGDSRPSRYDQLVLETYSSGRPRVVPPHVELAGHADANPTSGTLLVAPLLIDGEIRGTTELVVDRVPPAEELQQLLQLIGAACLTMADYERRRSKRALEARQSLIDEVERFTRTVHAELSTKQVAYAAVNDGRRIIGCDRVSLLIRRGNRWDLTAVSGLEVVESRSAAAKRLAEIATIVAETGESVWYDGGAADLAPQIREALAAYIDETHVRTIGIVPLVRPYDEAKTEPPPRPLGALVVEQIDSLPTEASTLGSGRIERARLVALHTTAALNNALEVDSIPLLSLWRSVGSLKKLFAPGTRTKTIAVTAILAAVVAALKFVPAELALSAKKTLQPTVRRHCFAPLDGTVQRIHVRHGDHVVAGQLLLELRSTDLDVQFAEALGKRAAAADELLSVERALFDEGAKLTAGERHRLSGQRSELKQELISFDEQLRLLRRKRDQLKVTSPIAGEVTTWNVEQLLANRPVRQGQTLIDVADTRGRWELELQVPEDAISHLLRAQAAQAEPLKVSYRLAADPDADRTSFVGEVHYAAEVRGDEGNTVLVRTTLADAELPPLRPGAEASAKVYCGRRALGYVWLHDAVDFIHSKVLFRLY